ncbi:phosphotransferase family protein [Nocardioides marmoribigeumensis]|uniref:Aminoglycoside phosphotransferase (APT) family kinase protein n=1 Tax=Nocardioides marmoribigeumensis TaxID=433649 RepID=A0ABU2BQY5_9ACTN|nr:phosphotransferase family protein [Nocardioides marmoribigeumensis]MDR7361060.1 aminoglycoside phosphotransferase (APT) family kinase protein [Nocardioides marmoribigeumensis]
MTSTSGPPADLRLQRSSRDAAGTERLLQDWLSGALPPGSRPTLSLLSGVDANGMSSETLVLDATWREGGEQRVGRYVARVAPAAEDFPVFPRYELREQYDVMRLVGEVTDVPVPQVGLIEPTGTVLGTPFFLMDRVEGVIPPDVLPYNFGDSWVHDATPEQQARLRDSSVAVLAGLHAIRDATTTFEFLDPARHGHDGETLLQRDLARTKAWYGYAAADIGRSPLAERALAWLEANVPETDPIDDVLCWGDARIGNMIYRDFEPVAVLDWEMACLGPRELDVSWMVFAHRVFESIAAALELPGMPDFLREEDVVATYEELSGARLCDLTWYHVYNGLQWCIVFMRTGARQIHFGEIERPDEVDSLMHCGPLMAQILDEVGA